KREGINFGRQKNGSVKRDLYMKTVWDGCVMVWICFVSYDLDICRKLCDRGRTMAAVAGRGGQRLYRLKEDEDGDD
nr:hypothetical protein [Tanacetum cinerariifolium]